MRSRCTYGGYSVASKRFKYRDAFEVIEPGDGRPGRKGAKFSSEAIMEEDEKSCMYIYGARTANRHR